MKSVWVVFFQLLRDVKAIHKLVGASFIGHLLDTVKHLHLNKNHGKILSKEGSKLNFSTARYSLPYVAVSIKSTAAEISYYGNVLDFL